MRNPIVAVDFDGVIAEYHGWRGVGVYGSPVPGAVKALQELAKAGWDIVIWTCRAEDDLIADYLEDFNIPYTAINQRVENFTVGSPKIYADAYVDDKGIYFDMEDPIDSWKRALTRLKEIEEKELEEEDDMEDLQGQI